MDTYKVIQFVRCANCKETDREKELDIEKGTEVKQHVKRMTCDNCGVKGKMDI